MTSRYNSVEVNDEVRVQPTYWPAIPAAEHSPSPTEKRDDEIRRLEASMRRMNEVDTEEIDSEEYQRILGRLVELRRERDGC